ncbi:DMT family transporter [Sulfitobacter sp. M57]|uniref:DMT family transporter n=1 Tax=unclassified Sulfitobacter TaxID=196795 RepID=UPI0023E1D44E|nr:MULTISPECIES: DMT family transporter [unclassified Sulfitobacter]MDF3413523.1 DMT family transporter [Sulfitobacter sp. KE5]MDF3421195.1 DMT family transporter [Sulfitobacter sp. KE43]MDF3432070.1 DMT family transporter [Sulfitobacter sp. KE42]MDF3457710.1 DMT family transporter [Sulfitobacter sp. S74]MDF3461612.1 DMT family transporter [Sulfitobacter sp. Ks18]
MNTLPINPSRLGIFCMLGGMLCISVNDMLVKSLSGSYPLHELIMLRSVVAIGFTVALLMAEGGFRLLNTGRWALHATRALFILIANTSLYAAIASLPLATATALYFVAPLFVTLLSIPILGETVGPRRFAAIGIGFLGVMTMMAPQIVAGEGGYGWVVVLPVVAAAFYASMSVLTRKLGQTSRASALALHMQFAFISVSAMVYLVAGDGRFVSPDSNPSLEFLLRAWVWPERGDLLPILGLGVLSAMVGYLMTQAYRLSHASAVAPFEYVLLIFSLFWGWTIFGEWPSVSVLAGAAIVIASGVYVFLREGRAKSDPRTG